MFQDLKTEIKLFLVVAFIAVVSILLLKTMQFPQQQQVSDTSS